MLAAWNGPFGDVRFCPTGGIGVQTAAQFLHLPNVLCVGGSWLTTRDLLAARDWAGPQGQGAAFLERATQVKTVWLPFGA